MDYVHRLLGGSGWYRVDDTSEHTIRHYGVVVSEDTVISAWTIGGVDLVAYFNISGKTITTADPAMIVPEKWVNEGSYSITLTSGSVDLLRA